MKNLLLLCLLLGTFRGVAQTHIDPFVHYGGRLHDDMPHDTATHKVCFTGKVPVPGASKAALHSAARKWFADYYKSDKAVLDMDDAQAGKLIGSGYSALGPIARYSDTVQLWTTTKVYVKDGRFRYEVTNFMQSPVANSTLKTPIEKDLGQRGTFSYDRAGYPRTRLRRLIARSSQEAAAQAASLRAAMAAAKPNRKKNR